MTVSEDGTLPFTGGNAISVVDASGTAEQLVLSVTKGTLTLGTTSGLTVLGNDSALGHADRASLSSLVNTDLATLIYTPTTDYLGPDLLSLSDTDTADGLTANNASLSITCLHSLADHYGSRHERQRDRKMPASALPAATPSAWAT